VNPTRPPARWRMPAFSACSMPADARPRRAAEQLLEVLGDGERLAGCRPGSLPGEGPGDLEGEQRVPLRDTVEPEQDGMVEVPPGPGSQEAGHRLLAQRAHGHPVKAQRRPCLTQTERVAAGANAQRHQDPDRRILQTADHERQHPGRRRVQPLDIVDRDDQRSGRGQRAQDAQGRERHRSLVRWSTLDLCSEERGVQRASLRRGQIR
jgi:hypothetical protein